MAHIARNITPYLLVYKYKPSPMKEEKYRLVCRISDVHAYGCWRIKRRATRASTAH